MFRLTTYCHIIIIHAATCAMHWLYVFVYNIWNCFKLWGVKPHIHENKRAHKCKKEQKKRTPETPQYKEFSTENENRWGACFPYSIYMWAFEFTAGDTVLSWHLLCYCWWSCSWYWCRCCCCFCCHWLYFCWIWYIYCLALSDHRLFNALPFCIFRQKQNKCSSLLSTHFVFQYNSKKNSILYFVCSLFRSFSLIPTHIAHINTNTGTYKSTQDDRIQHKSQNRYLYFKWEWKHCTRDIERE